MVHSAHAMSQILNGNGNGHGAQSLLRQIEKKVARAKAAASPHAIKESGVTFQTAEGVELRGVLSRVTRHTVVFELYDPDATLRLSEVLAGFEIIFQERTVYSGRATVRNVVNAGTKIICEAALKEEDWTGLDLTMALQDKGGIGKESKKFLKEWQKSYKVLPEFKMAVADLQMFLHDLRLWMEQVELTLQVQPEAERKKSEHRILQSLVEPILPILVSLFEKFEKLVSKTESESVAASILYVRRILLPLVLCAPFMRRTFEKPLGHAGDYEMVNMMVRNPFEGDSLFAKVLNNFFLNTPPVVAHRNRIDYLTQLLDFETYRVARQGRMVKVFNLGCGPATEIQRFLTDSSLNQNVEFTLLDFNDETVAYTERALTQIKDKYDCNSTLRVIKKSVAQLLKENAKFGRNSYDFVYCAGLFDYVPDAACAKLLELFYELVVPGGLVLVSNVHVNNPSRGWMEYMVDWHLIYRDADQMNDICPRHIPKEQIRVFIEPTGVNIFTEIRKPENV
jgi:extracellular factor (EF) 3-hydroxypalmitic acid methyl ester biosynthesis protein